MNLPCGVYKCNPSYNSSHLGRMPIFSIVVIHSDNPYFISFFHYFLFDLEIQGIVDL